MEPDELYMQRCFQLALQGAGKVAPNPLVGAVLVYEGKIIGEGAHLEYGKAHAEVNAIASVPEELKSFIPFATLYVSLEPCSHFGKTPPCVDLILQKGIKRVVIANKDPFDAVNGSGIARLRQAGVQVVTGIKTAEGAELNRRFFTFHQKKRPYIILKWAQSADGYIDDNTSERLHITNAYSNRLVHRWRSEEAAIAVGTNTALMDNPMLTNRLWSGKSPIRVLLDTGLGVPANSHLLDRTVPAIVLHDEGVTARDSILQDEDAEDENDPANAVRSSTEKAFLHYRAMPSDSSMPEAFCDILYQENVQSVLVEGGAKTLQQFIDSGLYDEVRVLTNSELFVHQGIHAPSIHQKTDLLKTAHLLGDRIEYFRKG